MVAGRVPRLQVRERRGGFMFLLMVGVLPPRVMGNVIARGYYRFIPGFPRQMDTKHMDFAGA